MSLTTQTQRTQRGIRRSVAMLAVALATMAANGCRGHWLPSERDIYRGACEAIHAEPAAASLALAPIDDCKLYIGKSAARIDVPVADGSDAYTVWLKRVARTWTVDRVYRSSSPPAAGSADVE